MRMLLILICVCLFAFSATAQDAKKSWLEEDVNVFSSEIPLNIDADSPSSWEDEPIDEDEVDIEEDGNYYDDLDAPISEKNPPEKIEVAPQNNFPETPKPIKSSSKTQSDDWGNHEWLTNTPKRKTSPPVSKPTPPTKSKPEILDWKARTVAPPVAPKTKAKGFTAPPSSPSYRIEPKTDAMQKTAPRKVKAPTPKKVVPKNNWKIHPDRKNLKRSTPVSSKPVSAKPTPPKNADDIWARYDKSDAVPFARVKSTNDIPIAEPVVSGNEDGITLKEKILNVMKPTSSDPELTTYDETEQEASLDNLGSSENILNNVSAESFSNNVRDVEVISEPTYTEQPVVPAAVPTINAEAENLVPAPSPTPKPTYNEVNEFAQPLMPVPQPITIDNTTEYVETATVINSHYNESVLDDVDAFLDGESNPAPRVKHARENRNLFTENIEATTNTTPARKPILDRTRATEMFFEAQMLIGAKNPFTTNERRRKALALYVEILRDFPTYSRAGKVAYNAGRINESNTVQNATEAIRMYRLCVELDKKTMTDARLRAAILLEKIGQYNEAVIAYKDVLENSYYINNRKHAAKRISILSPLSYGQ